MDRAGETSLNLVYAGFKRIELLIRAYGRLDDVHRLQIADHAGAYLPRHRGDDRESTATNLHRHPADRIGGI